MQMTEVYSFIGKENFVHQGIVCDDITNAVIREIQEETGLRISSPLLCGIKDWYENGCRYVVLFYKTTHFEGELVSSEEGKVWWEKIDNLPNLRKKITLQPIDCWHKCLPI